MMDKVQKPSNSGECVNHKYFPFPYITIPFVISSFLRPSIFLKLLFLHSRYIFFSYCKIPSFTPVPKTCKVQDLKFSLWQCGATLLSCKVGHKVPAKSWQRSIQPHDVILENINLQRIKFCSLPIFLYFNFYVD
jgi:hypothetical protein